MAAIIMAQSPNIYIYLFYYFLKNMKNWKYDFYCFKKYVNSTSRDSSKFLVDFSICGKCGKCGSLMDCNILSRTCYWCSPTVFARCVQIALLIYWRAIFLNHVCKTSPKQVNNYLRLEECKRITYILIPI